MKIITIVGARPQFIKAAALSIALRENNINEIIIHTGQHYDKNMSDVFFRELNIPKVKYNLNINNLNHGAMTGLMMMEIEKIIIKEKPNFIMVYGDTNSTLAGALAGKKLNIKIIHVEAGLRSYNIQMPEEVNRIVTDRISDILFCPSSGAKKNLFEEGQNIFDCIINVSGDVMEDALNLFMPIAEKKSKILKKYNLKKNQFCICTLHRQENTDNQKKLKNIVLALNSISKNYNIIMPIHPRTESVLRKYNLDLMVNLIPPVSYLDMLVLLKNCGLVMTDSGGLQKEAYFMDKYCITLRNETEWVELVKNGYNILVGSEFDRINKAFKKYYSKNLINKIELYGGGKATTNIVKFLLEAQ
jgi:UDP-GlcNAc3NAcA epimerase